LPDANWLATIHHGLPVASYRPDFRQRAAEPYLAFLGRFSRDKRPDRAIEIARRTGLRIRLAAKIGDDDRAYFHETVEPLLDGERVTHVGEIEEHRKAEFLGGAAGLLFPIDWPEPFGLAVIEAMACGTPVIAWNCGAMPEIVEEGVTGFVVDTVEEAVLRVPAPLRRDPRGVRSGVQRRGLGAKKGGATTPPLPPPFCARSRGETAGAPGPGGCPPGGAAARPRHGAGRAAGDRAARAAPAVCAQAWRLLCRRRRLW